MARNLCADILTRPQTGQQWVLDNVTWKNLVADIKARQDAGTLTDADIDQAKGKVQAALAEFVTFIQNGIQNGSGVAVTNLCGQSPEWKRAAVEEAAFAEKVMASFEALKAGAPSGHTGPLTSLLPPSIGDPLSAEVIKGTGITWSYVVLGIILLLMLMWLLT